MDTNKSVAILLAFIMLCAGNVSCTAMAQPQSEPKFEREREDEESSYIRVASCLLKITSDSSVFPISKWTVRYLANSSGVASKAAREVFDMTSADVVDMKPIDVEDLNITPDGLSRVFNLEVYDIEQGEEFMDAVIINLQEALHRDFDIYRDKLRKELQLAEQQTEIAHRELSAATGVTPADKAVGAQLDQLVDLSPLTEGTSFADAVAILRDSIEPSLPIVVMWGDLSENAFIEQNTEINMSGEGLRSDALRAGLERILQSTGGTKGDSLPVLGFTVQDGIITIATQDNLHSHEKKLLQNVETDIPLEVTIENKQRLLRQKQEVDMEIARLGARSTAIGQQVARISQKISEKIQGDVTISQLENLIEKLELRREARVNIKTTDEFFAATEKIVSLRLQLAEHTSFLTKAAGGDLLNQFNDELAMLMVNLAEQEARLQVINKYLEQTKSRLSVARRFEPEAIRASQAREALENALQHENDLRSRLANLKPPLVSVLGAD
jgi:hypothetical protein